MPPAHRALTALAALAVGGALVGWRLTSPPAERMRPAADGTAANVVHPAAAPAPLEFHRSPGGEATDQQTAEGECRRDLTKALAEPDAVRRGEALVNALHAWGAVEVHAAGTWAAAQTLIDPTRAVAAVLNGAVAAGRTEEAAQMVSHLGGSDPARAHDYRAAHIHALGAAGHHPRAAAIAAEGAGPTATSWLALAYSAWARSDPEAAMIAAGELTDLPGRRVAFQAAGSAWARVDPRRLADYSLAFPAGPERDFALVSALRSWSAIEPAATAAWMHVHRDVLAGVNRIQLVLED